MKEKLKNLEVRMKQHVNTEMCKIWKELWLASSDEELNSSTGSAEEAEKGVSQ